MIDSNIIHVFPLRVKPVGVVICGYPLFIPCGVVTDRGELEIVAKGPRRNNFRFLARE
jgi:hypothetical protein